MARTDLVYLLDDWVSQGDTAVIAVSEYRQMVGAAWYRFWNNDLHSYGYVSPEIPELGIAVRREFRSMGIGHQLLDARML